MFVTVEPRPFFIEKKNNRTNASVRSFLGFSHFSYCLFLFVCSLWRQPLGEGKIMRKKEWKHWKLWKQWSKLVVVRNIVWLVKSEKLSCFNLSCLQRCTKKKIFFFCSAHVCGPFIVLTFCHWLVWSLLWLAMGTVVCLQWLHQQPSALNKCYLRTFCLLCLSYFI